MVTNEQSAAAVGHSQEPRGGNEFEQSLLVRLIEDDSTVTNEQSAEPSIRSRPTCPACGAERRNDSRYCSSCGARQTSVPTSAAVQAQDQSEIRGDVHAALDLSPSPESAAAVGHSQERRGDIEFEQSILARAKNNDTSAITTMFRQFVPPEETISAVQYLGIEGIWGFGTHSFGCLTNRRIAAIRVAFLGEVVYQDGYLEYVNSGVVYQPSKLWLYIYVGVLVLAALFIPGIPFVLRVLPLLLIPLAIRLYYRMFKCGLVLWIREGVSIYMFTNRSRLVVANRMYRMIDKLRGERLKEVGHPV